MKPGMKVHLIGAGDYNMTEVSALPDPCPLPDQEKKRQVRFGCDFRTVLTIVCTCFDPS